MGYADFTGDEITKRGKAIYETQLKTLLEPEHIGKFLVIDVETGEYEIGENDLAVSQSAYHKNPNGARFGMRIGYRASGTLGGKRYIIKE